MKPSTTPRLAPNGGSKLKPAWILLAMPVAIATIAYPPLAIPLLLGGGLTLGIKLGLRVGRRRHEAAEAQAVREFHERMAQQRLTRDWTNPGWRA